MSTKFLVPTTNANDPEAIRRAIQKLSRKLGPIAEPTYTGLTLTGLTASRIVASDADKKLVSIDLDAWILEGSANQVIVTDEGDGTVTLSTPQNIHTGASPTFAGLTIPTTGEINFRDSDISIASKVDGVLDINADISIDMFYDNADVGDETDGQSLNINRRAGEGDDYVSLYVSKDRNGLIGFSGDNDLLQLAANALTVNGTVTITGTVTGDNFLGGTGTQANPTYSFSAFPTAGMYIPAAGVLGFAVSGEALRISSTLITSSLPITLDKGELNITGNNATGIAGTAAVDVVDITGGIGGVHATGGVGGKGSDIKYTAGAGGQALGGGSVGGAGGDIDLTPGVGGVGQSSNGSDGITTIGDGGVTNYTQINITGDMSYAGSAKLTLPNKTGSTTEGDFWKDTVQKAVQGFIAGIEQTLVGCIFTQTADQTIADTTTETTMFGTGVGTLTLPANFWTVGKTIRLEIHGDFADTGNPTAEVQVYQGATSLIDSGAITLSGLAATEEWSCHVIITCRSIGTTGTLETNIDWEYETTVGSSAIERLDAIGTTTTINTTVSQVLDTTFQWGTAAAANTLTSEVGLVEVIN